MRAQLNAPEQTKRDRRSSWALGFRLGGASLLLAGCASSPSGETAPATSTSTETVTPTITKTVPAPTTGDRQLRIRFTDLGGGSPIIQAYPGTGTSDADTTPLNITYHTGNEVLVDCYESGREVTSHTEVGEAYRQSDIWYRLVGGPAVAKQYATAVYAEPFPLDPQIPRC